MERDDDCIIYSNGPHPINHWVANYLIVASFCDLSETLLQYIERIDKTYHLRNEDGDV